MLPADRGAVSRGEDRSRNNTTSQEREAPRAKRPRTRHLGQILMEEEPTIPADDLFAATDGNHAPASLASSIDDVVTMARLDVTSVAAESAVLKPVVAVQAGPHRDSRLDLRKAKISKRWRDKYALLARYVAEHGDARVPRDLDTATYRKLGVWVNSQRMAYRAEKLRAQGKVPKTANRINAIQIELLNKLNFLWSGSIHRQSWASKFAQLKRFIAEHGHARVPVRCSAPEYSGLGQWVMTMRRAFRMEKLRQQGKQPKSSDRISKDQIAMLDSVGFKWSIDRGARRGQCDTECESGRGRVQVTAMQSRSDTLHSSSDL